MSPSNNPFSIFKSSKAKATTTSSSNNINEIKSNQDPVFQNSIFYEEFDPSLFSSSPSSTLSSSSTKASSLSKSSQKSNQNSIFKRIQNYHQNQKELRKYEKELRKQEIEKSPYFIQTWYDPQPISTNSQKSSPISLVSYLPPIWVDEEIEEISNETDQTSIQEEEKREECIPPLIIITSTEEEEEDVTQEIAKSNRLPKQDCTLLNVPESLRRSRLTQYIPFIPKCVSNNEKTSIVLKNSSTTTNKSNQQKDQRKIRFELGARLDPNENCFLNFSHSIQSKRCYHRKNNKCCHVRFIIGSKGEESGPTMTRENGNLQSCLKVKTQLESLLIAAKNETFPKSILRKSSSSNSTITKKSLKVEFDLENVFCNTVDRHIELAIEIRDRKMIRRVVREIKLEKRRQFILTKPIERWIDTKEKDEGLPRESDLEETEEEEKIKIIQKTEEERLQKRLNQFKLKNQSNQLAKLNQIYQRKKHLMMLLEHLDFSNSITHKIRFEKEFNNIKKNKFELSS